MLTEACIRMATPHTSDHHLDSKLHSITLSDSEGDTHTQLNGTRRHINNLPPEILRLILEYANTCNAPHYVTLKEILQAVSQIQPQECVFNIPGLPFSVSDQAPPLLALLWARQVCRLWQTISDEIIYEDLSPDNWLRPEIGDQFLDFLRHHLEQRELSEHCYAQTHTMTKTILADHDPSYNFVVLHLMVIHHMLDRQMSFHVFRQTPKSYTAFPSISRDQQIWPGCDCIRPQSAGVAIGTPFIHVLASDNELQKVVQLVWRTTFRLGSNQLIAGLQHLAVARRLLDA